MMPTATMTPTPRTTPAPQFGAIKLHALEKRGQDAVDDRWTIEITGADRAKYRDLLPSDRRSSMLTVRLESFGWASRQWLLNDRLLLRSTRPDVRDMPKAALLQALFSDLAARLEKICLSQPALKAQVDSTVERTRWMAEMLENLLEAARETSDTKEP